MEIGDSDPPVIERTRWQLCQQVTEGYKSLFIPPSLQSIPLSSISLSLLLSVSLSSTLSSGEGRVEVLASDPRWRSL